MKRLSKIEMEKLINSLMKVRVELQPLLEKKEALEETLKQFPGEYNTKNIRAIIADQIRTTVNWNRAKKDLKLDDQLLAPYTESKTVRVLRLLAR